METLGPYFAGYGYFGIAAIVLLGNLGFPVPEEAVVLFAGYLTWRGTLQWPLVLLIAVGSAVAGDNLGYWVGRKHGRAILLRYGRYVAITPRLIRKAERFFHDQGEKAVFFGRFVAGIRFLAGPLAGAAGMPFSRFFLFNLSGALVWISLMVGLGNLFGEHLHLLLRRVRQAEVLGIGFGLAVLLIVWLRHRRATVTERWRTRRAARAGRRPRHAGGPRTPNPDGSDAHVLPRGGVRPWAGGDHDNQPAAENGEPPASEAGKAPRRAQELAGACPPHGGQSTHDPPRPL